MSVIFSFLAGIGLGWIIGKLGEFNAIQEVEEGNRILVNQLIDDILDLQEQINKQHDQAA